MKGDIYAWGVCKCGGEWNYIRDSFNKVSNILCASCGVPPEKFGVDARSFKNRRNKGKGERITHGKDGHYLESIHQTKRLLETIRARWDERGPERFDITEFSRSGRESYKLAECAREWQLYLKERGASRGYLAHVELFFRLHIVPHLPADIDIRELVPDDVEKMQIALKAKGLSQNTVKNALTVLRTLLKRYHYRKMVLDKLIPFPEKWSATPQIDRHVVDEATQRDIWLKMATDTHLLMETLCALGCRPSEACGLKRKDLLPDGRVMIQRSINAFGIETTTKTHKSRTHNIGSDLHRRLSELPVLPEGYLFSRNGLPFNPNRLSSMFDAINPLRGRVTLYTMSRHSLASRIAREAREEGYRQAGKALGNNATISKIHYVME